MARAEGRRRAAGIVQAMSCWRRFVLAREKAGALARMPIIEHEVR